MKHIVKFLIALLLVFNSCTKEQHPPPELIGSWQWKISHGFQPGYDETPENTGIEKLLVLTEDFKWERLENNNIVGSGRFSVGQGRYSSYFRTLIYDSIVFHKPGETKATYWDYYEVKVDTLTFCGCFAGFTGMKTKYIRQLK